MPWILIITHIVLLLPIIDFLGAVSWLFDSPLIAGLYLTITIVIGVLLMKLGQIGLSEILYKLRRNELLIDSRLFSGFAAVWLVGVLLAFPGYISDIIAMLLLCFAFLRRGHDSPRQPYHKNDDTLQVEGEIISEEDKQSEKHFVDSTSHSTSRKNTTRHDDDD